MFFIILKMNDDLDTKVTEYFNTYFKFQHELHEFTQILKYKNNYTN
jgi:hypothetical protein